MEIDECIARTKQHTGTLHTQKKYYYNNNIIIGEESNISYKISISLLHPQK